LNKCIFCDSEYDKENEKCKNLDCGLSNQPRMLVDWEIEKLIDMKIIKILPILDIKKQIVPFGLDLTLDTKFKKIIKSNNPSIDPIEPYTKDQYYNDVELLLSNTDDDFVLHPGEFTLGQSFEFISIPEFIVGGLDGKSSLGRLSLTVHTTAGSIDPGFSGHITFELFNAGGLPIILHPLQSIARIIFHLTSKAKNVYVGEYAGQTEVRPSKYYESAFAKILKKQTKRLP